MKKGKEHAIRCARCNRRQRAGSEGWNVAADNGVVVAFICPRCQTPEENAEAIINEATLDYGVDDQGRFVAYLKGHDECVVCGQKTDTGLGFRGELEWTAYVLLRLGVPPERVKAIFENGWPAMVTHDENTRTFRVCAECVAECNSRLAPDEPKLEVGRIAWGEKNIPMFEQRVSV